MKGTLHIQQTSQKCLPKPRYKMLVIWHYITQASLLNLCGFRTVCFPHTTREWGEGTS